MRVAVEPVESRVLLSTYYVSASSGADANPGTSDAAAFKTLQKAANTVKAGDTVFVRAGTYTAGMNLFGNAGGRAGAPISFLADPGATITRSATSGVNASMAAINIENSQWFVIQGFTITDNNQTTTRGGIRVALSPNCVVRNNTITGCFDGVFAARANGVVVEGNVCRNSFGEHGIYVNGCQGYTIAGNECYGNPWNGIHTNVAVGANQINSDGLIENNVVHDNDLAGCDFTGMANTTVRNNIVYGNDRHAIVLQNSNGEATVACHDDVIVNNTFDAREGSSAYAIQISDLSDQPAGSTWTGNDNNITIFNNILFGNPSGAYGAIGVSRTPPPSFYSDYNVTDGRFSTAIGSGQKTLAQWRTATGQDQHSLVATATQLFVNAAAGDYHLKLGSPAVDTGTGSINGASAPAVDAKGDPRPQGAGFDVGYDERPVDLTSPTAALAAPDILTGAGAYTFTVTYTDTGGIDVSSLDDGDIVVTDTGGADLPVTFVGVDTQTDGSPRVATYQLDAPGGDWDVADLGTYSVGLVASQVRDVSGNFAAAGAIGAFVVRVPSEVIGRSIGYDDGAGFVAEDKQPLLPGAGPATFANYTNADTGITAIALDLNNLPAAAAPTASSFAFRVGDGTTWQTAPAPAAVTVTRGGGAEGTDRILITWPAGAVRDTWLEVTANADEGTGLARRDVFYFGSLAGDTNDGNNSSVAVVNVRDVGALRRAITQAAALGAPGARFDFNHDGIMNALDVLVIRANQAATLPLILSATPAGASAAGRAPANESSITPVEGRGPTRTRRAAYDVLAARAVAPQL